MPIVFDCPFCERTHHVDHRYAGRGVLCKKCGKPIRVPKADSESEGSEAGARVAVGESKKKVVTAIQAVCPSCSRLHKLDPKYAGKLIKCKGCEQPFRVVALAGGGAGLSSAGGSAVEDEREALAERELEECQAERIRSERERLARERAEEERAEAQRAEEERARAERDRIEAERLEEEREEAALAEAARAEKLRIERERIDAARAEAARIAAERARAEEERLAAERAEAERVALERAEAERVAAEREAAERAREEAERAEAARVQTERLAAERARVEEERLAAERAEAERVALERAEAARVEAERLAAERARAEAERAAAELARAEAVRLAEEKAAAERAERERAQEAARVAAERAEKEREERARVEAEKLAAQRAEEARVRAEREAEEKARLEAARLAAERAEKARLEAEREKAAREEAARLRAQEERAAEKARLEAARLEVERERQRVAEAARLELARKEAERAAAEKAEAQRQEAARKEAERIAAEEAESQRQEAARKEAERLAAEKAEAQRREAERVDNDKAEAERLRLEQERAAAQAEADRVAANLAEQKRLAAEAEAARLQAERETAARLETQRLAREAEAEKSRIASENADALRVEARSSPLLEGADDDATPERGVGIDEELAGLSAKMPPPAPPVKKSPAPQESGLKGLWGKLKRSLGGKGAESAPVTPPAPVANAEVRLPAIDEPREVVEVEEPLGDATAGAFELSEPAGVSGLSDESEAAVEEADAEKADETPQPAAAWPAGEDEDLSLEMEEAQTPMALLAEEPVVSPTGTELVDETATSVAEPQTDRGLVAEAAQAEVVETAEPLVMEPLAETGEVIEAVESAEEASARRSEPLYVESEPSVAADGPSLEVEQGHRTTVEEPLTEGLQSEQALARTTPPVPEERSPGGSTIFRHAPKTGQTALSPPLTPYLPHITQHIEKTIGRAPIVFHEIISIGIHIDLHIIPPTNEPASALHPRGSSHFTIVTSGMSTKPMQMPPGCDYSPHAELMICLPVDWPGMRIDGTFDAAMMRDETNWWPFRWLKAIARMPHEYNTFVGPGHTIPNGPAATPFAVNTALGCMLVQPSVLNPRASRLMVSNNVTIQFYALWPVYREEMELKQQKGMDVLATRFRTSGTSELIQLDRKNVGKG